MEHQKQLPRESLLPAYICIFAMIFLQVAITDKLSLGPKYLLAALELLLILGAALTHPSSALRSNKIRRSFSLMIVLIVTFTNIASLGLVCAYLIEGQSIPGHTLILSAFAIYMTNILIFGLWYWEMDSPGLSGYKEPSRGPDFLFPQMTARYIDPACKAWQPSFYDYLYISVTSATAFSPTDAMPLTHRVKLLMAIQSLTSLATVTLVAARAVNILS